jgi:hypothetical protein
VGIVFKNNAKTTLASNLSNSATSATVTDGSVFPTLGAGEFFLITFDDGTNNEICKCTARSSNTLTIVRAQDNTSARAFSSGDAAEGRVTAGVLETIQENIAAKSANQTVYNATTASSATAYNIGIDPGVEANAMVFLDGVMQHHDTFSFSGSTLTFDAAPVDGTKLEVIVDNLINLQSSNLTVDTFTAADVGGSAQTDFTLSDTPAAETNLIVFVEGVFQDQDAYTISSNTLSITTGVIAGRGVTVYVINPVNIGTPSDGTITSAKLSGNLTLPGTLTVGANDVAFDSPTFVVDNSNSRVGLGTASPTVPVDIVGDVKMSANLTVDTTTLVVDSTNNNVLLGTSNQGHIRLNQQLGLAVTGNVYGGISMVTHSSSAGGNRSLLDFNRSRNTTIGSHTVVQSGDSLGTIVGRGDDGDEFLDAATIDFEVDGTPGDGDMPGRIVFATTADGASSVTERMRITSGGDVCIGGTNDVHTSADIGTTLHILSETSGTDVSLHLHPDVGEYSLYAYNGYLAILDHTADTERIRLDSSGNLQIVGGNQMTQGLFFYNGGDGHLLSGIRNKSNSSYNDSGGLEFLTSGTSNAAESVKMSIDTQGNVGIGPTSPATLLHLQSAAPILRATDSNDTDKYGQIEFDNGDIVISADANSGGGYQSGSKITFCVDSGGEKMRITNDGKVGVMETNPSEGVHLGGITNGYMALSGNLSGYSANQYPALKTDGATIHFDANGTYTGYISHNTGFTDVSDEREKDNIETITEATSLVKQLRGVTHKWKDKRDEKTHYGLIAQEVEKIVPDVVSEGATKEGETEPTKGVAYQKLVPLLIETIKELEARIKTLEDA